MTYKEKLLEQNPSRVSSVYWGCEGCPGTYWGGQPHLTTCGRVPSPDTCTACWNKEIPGTTKPTTEIDIHKIIDDAMEKKDRSVMIFIGKEGVNVSVTPFEDTKPRWIDKDTIYACSECGALNKWPSPFCPLCGEKLALHAEEGKDDECSK